jgi:hypothetical protein
MRALVLGWSTAGWWTAGALGVLLWLMCLIYLSGAGPCVTATG